MYILYFIVLHCIILGFLQNLMALFIYKRSLDGSKNNIQRLKRLNLKTSIRK